MSTGHFHQRHAYKTNLAGSTQNGPIVKQAQFPQAKPFKTFESELQPNINQQQIMVLQDYAFMKINENMVCIGSPRVGKTHLAISIGMEACRYGKPTLFINSHELLLRHNTTYDKRDTRSF